MFLFIYITIIFLLIIYFYLVKKLYHIMLRFNLSKK
jgi:hypothetical protein